MTNVTDPCRPVSPPPRLCDDGDDDCAMGRFEAGDDGDDNATRRIRDRYVVSKGIVLSVSSSIRGIKVPVTFSFDLIRS